MEKSCTDLGAIAEKTMREPASCLLPCQRLAGMPHELAGDEINCCETEYEYKYHYFKPEVQ